MSAIKLDGRRVADRMLEQLKKKVSASRKPITLAYVLVGNRFDSALYGKLKRQAAARVGIETEFYHLPSATSQKKLEQLIRVLNKRRQVSGILLQLPLPAQLNADSAVGVMDPHKDVDGFHLANTFVVSPPVAAVIKLISLGKPAKNSFVVIVAKQSIFTKDLALALEKLRYTVAIVETHPKLKEITTKADILITALGTGPQLTAKYIKNGAIVIDVGIRKHGKKAIGDIHVSAWNKAKAISPVPGGVGPLVIATALENTYHLAKLN